MSKLPPIRGRVRVLPVSGPDLWKTLPLPKRMLENETAQYRRAYYATVWFPYYRPRSYRGRRDGLLILWHDVRGFLPMGVN